jgi:hypothetical protein
MLTPYRPHFIEQIVTDPTGRQFRLVFLVSNVDGKLKGHLVSAEPISAKAQLSGSSEQPTFFLPIICPQNKTVTEYISSFTPIVSPYNELFFFTSQPTRAPSL